MATYQCVFIFNQGRYGWTETWYKTGSTHEAVVPLSTTLATRRTRLLATGASIEAVRISDVTIAGDSVAFPLGKDGTVQTQGADTPWNAIYCRVNSGALYRRQLWLRGIPDVWIELENGNVLRNTVAGALNTAFNAFRTTLVGDGWLMKCIQKDGPGATFIDVTAFSLNVDGFLQFSIAGLAGVPGDTFRISKAQGPNPKLVNGVYTIRSNNGAVVVSTYKPGEAFDPADYANLKAKPRIIQYNGISDGRIMRPAKRSTGRAFFVQRGRRPVTK